jgi:hypothetical protein
MPKINMSTFRQRGYKFISNGVVTDVYGEPENNPSPTINPLTGESETPVLEWDNTVTSTSTVTNNLISENKND